MCHSIVYSIDVLYSRLFVITSTSIIVLPQLVVVGVVAFSHPALSAACLHIAIASHFPGHFFRFAFDFIAEGRLVARHVVARRIVVVRRIIIEIGAGISRIIVAAGVVAAIKPGRGVSRRSVGVVVAGGSISRSVIVSATSDVTAALEARVVVSAAGAIVTGGHGIGGGVHVS